MILTQTISETINIVIMKAIFMSNLSNGKVKTRSPLPKVPPLHEEPVGGLEAGKELCHICGKTFKTHSQLDKHMEQIHVAPEKTHIGPHKVE